ncbi:hypothetical protein BT63DRAFT_49903 [Microthyrium microscopicum]|uniref:Uncharacterized protein n=1 Tax=Microthyrium microscopicum TaxID=703497 RepID=A0A6A6U3U3_9PEZI|nr:hypothetical protein BT63DRAFT_49903 [Microthyrium microscopicum]
MSSGPDITSESPRSNEDDLYSRDAPDNRATAHAPAEPQAVDNLADFMISQHGIHSSVHDNAARHAQLKAKLLANTAPTNPLYVDQLGTNGLSPLHIAIKHRRMGCIELLLAHGASMYVRATGHDNVTALQWIWDFAQSQQSIYRKHYLYDVVQFGVFVTKFPSEKLWITSNPEVKDIPGREDESSYRTTVSQLEDDTFAKYIKPSGHIRERLTWIHVSSGNVSELTEYKDGAQMMTKG